MKKNNISFFLIIFFIFGGCTRRKGPELLISKWEEKIKLSEGLERSLASTGPWQAQCLREIFSVDHLKKQIAELEASYAGAKKVSGTWKHINLSDLPVPQGNFLVSYGDQIGDLAKPDAIDYRSCYDVPCIYNKIYGKAGDIAGYVHYLWYLRMGSMLSADNLVPHQVSSIPGQYQGKNFPLSDYLFDYYELYGLWRLSMMLKPPHTNLTYLKEVQRLPRRNKYETRGENVCGVASSEGWITLQDRCLTIDRTNFDYGSLYESVLHELNHQLDYQEGKGTKKFYRSRMDDYLKISGFSLNEYQDDKGVQVREWLQRKDIKLVTEYAGKTPVENFAETLAIFRIDGDLTKKKITPEHFSFVQSDYYDGKDFLKNSLLGHMLKNYEAHTNKAVFQAVVECSKLSSAPKSAYFNPRDFSSPMTGVMLNCIGTRAQEISEGLKTKIAIYEPDGCRSLDEESKNSQWNNIVKANLRQSFERYFQELLKDKEYLARINSFYSELKDKTIARNAYLNCFGKTGEESCFQLEIRELILEKTQRLKLSDQEALEMADIYVSYHSFHETQNETRQLYKTFIKGHLEEIRNETIHLWGNCSTRAQDDLETPVSGILQIAGGYMISSLYNCLNQEANVTLKEIVRNLSVDGVKLQHASEEVILNQEVKAEMIKFLSDIYEKERDKELEQGMNLMSKDKGELRKKVLSDFSWVTSISDNGKIASDCKMAAYTVIDYPEHFSQKKDVFSFYVDANVCQNVQNTPEFKRWLNASGTQLTNAVLDGLDEKILAKAQEQASQCILTFPVDSALAKVKFKKERENCLLNSWAGLENQLIKETLADPVVIKFKVPEESLREKLELNRRRYQLRIMKERFN